MVELIANVSAEQMELSDLYPDEEDVLEVTWPVFAVVTDGNLAVEEDRLIWLPEPMGEEVLERVQKSFIGLIASNDKSENSLKWVNEMKGK